MMDFVAQVGETVTDSLAYLGALASLVGRVAYYVFVGPFQGKPLRWQGAISQATEVGVRALPILSLITFFIGLILALQSAYELRKLGALSLVATAVAVTVTREIGPLITAILVIGRSGSAFAAEIGTMRITQEIDALETMAIEPVDFLVTPKFLAMIVMMPCLTLWANTMGILGGSLFGVAQADFTWARYIRSSLDSLYLRDIAIGLIKSVMFGITITAVGCYEGLSTGGGAEEIGRSTTQAVVISIFSVIAVDLVFTAIFFFVSGR
jgi:phospholipid/cholesterol/gamma-HCH transport system permease protein